MYLYIFFRTWWVNLSKCSHVQMKWPLTIPRGFSTNCLSLVTPQRWRACWSSVEKKNIVCTHSSSVTGKFTWPFCFKPFDPVVRYTMKKTRLETLSVCVKTTDISGLQHESRAHLLQQHGWQSLMHTSQQSTKKTNELHDIFFKFILVHILTQNSVANWISGSSHVAMRVAVHTWLSVHTG